MAFSYKNKLRLVEMESFDNHLREKETWKGLFLKGLLLAIGIFIIFYLSNFIKI